MKKLTFIFSISFMLAQVNYSGEVTAKSMTRISNKLQINLPYRIFSLNLGYTLGSIDINTVTGIEYRNKPSESNYVLREAYLAYYPEWGEVKFGKQIHAWGSADGNNPTDNINPYDYYYLFKIGEGRKIGVISFSTKLYFGNANLEGVIIPKYEKNRFPYGEKDFPLSIPTEPEIKYPVENEYEFGFRLQTTLGESDIGLSLFRGSDRAPSLRAGNITYEVEGGIPQIEPLLGYRETLVTGLDFVTFIGDLTLRGEAAHFRSRSPILKLNLFKTPLSLYEFQQDITYSQYVLQVEYTTNSDIILSGQLIGNSVLDEAYEWYHSSSIEYVDFPSPEFQPGMGNPIAMFSELALLLSSTGVLMDDRLELKSNIMANLDEKGNMFSASIGYSPWINWKLETIITKFNGDKDDLDNTFTIMEDFSNLSFNIIYNF
jgi:hypothetical protein|tara:strand:- start:1930 stop:3222 length:1293 start_codon:yes stop_codon:yes gene_type:complete